MQIHSDWFIEQTTRYNTGAINRVRIVQRCNRDCIQYDCRRTALRNRNPHYHNRSRTGSRKGKGRTGDLGPTGSRRGRSHHRRDRSHHRRGRSHHRRGRSHRRGLPRCLQRQPSRPQTPWPRPAISGRPLANLPSMAPPMTLACRPITSNDRSRQSSTFLLLTPQVMTKTERKREKEKKNESWFIIQPILIGRRHWADSLSHSGSERRWRRHRHLSSASVNECKMKCTPSITLYCKHKADIYNTGMPTQWEFQKKKWNKIIK